MKFLVAFVLVALLATETFKRNPPVYDPNPFQIRYLIITGITHEPWEAE